MSWCAKDRISIHLFWQKNQVKISKKEHLTSICATSSGYLSHNELRRGHKKWNNAYRWRDAVYLQKHVLYQFLLNRLSDVPSGCYNKILHSFIWCFAWSSKKCHQVSCVYASHSSWIGEPKELNVYINHC